MTGTTNIGAPGVSTPNYLNPFSPNAPARDETDAQKELAIRLVREDQIEKNGKLDPSLARLFDRANIDLRSAPELLDQVSSVRQSLHSSEGRKRYDGATDKVYSALRNEWNDQAIADAPLVSRLLSGVLDPFSNIAPAKVDWGKERDRLGLENVGRPPVSDKTVQGCAQMLLDSKNVSFWDGLSTGSDRTALEQIAKTGKSYVPATGETITPNLDMMQALVEMSKKGPIQITALTGGEHSTGSNHYSGTAVDLSIYTGDAAQIESIANAHGGARNYETDHIHLDF